MTCHEVQVSLPLYLYGELEFAGEEELESHLAGCSLCQMALAREQSWHTSLNGEHQDVPLELLSQCRRDLRAALEAQPGAAVTSASIRLPQAIRNWLRYLYSLVPFAGRWSPRLAFASLFLFLGFSLSRWVDHHPVLGGIQDSGLMQAGLAPSFSRIRAIQTREDDRVRIVLDQVQPREVIGNVNDAIIRELLLRGSKDPLDPGLRVDAVELLKDYEGSDVRDSLVNSVLHDENAAVRLKALEGLRRFHNERPAHEALLQVLQDDASPAVRTEAIDVLIPADSAEPVSPELAIALQSILESQSGDDYLHARCMQILRSGRHSGLY